MKINKEKMKITIINTEIKACIETEQRQKSMDVWVYEKETQCLTVKKHTIKYIDGTLLVLITIQP